jgi:hypothetical protein
MEPEVTTERLREIVERDCRASEEMEAMAAELLHHRQGEPVEPWAWAVVCRDGYHGRVTYDSAEQAQLMVERLDAKCAECGATPHRSVPLSPPAPPERGALREAVEAAVKANAVYFGGDADAMLALSEDLIAALGGCSDE